MWLIKPLLIILSDGVRKQGFPRNETGAALPRRSPEARLRGHYTEKDVTLSPKVCVVVVLCTVAVSSDLYLWAVTVERPAHKQARLLFLFNNTGPLSNWKVVGREKCTHVHAFPIH